MTSGCPNICRLPSTLSTRILDFGCFTQGYLEAPSGLSTEPMWRKFGLIEGVQPVASSTALQLHYMVAYMNSQATVVRTDVLRKHGGFFENRCTFGEDSFLWLKILLNEQVAFTLRPGVVIHQRGRRTESEPERARGRWNRS